MSRDTRWPLAAREAIRRPLAAGGSLRAIARPLGRAPSPLTRERSRVGRTRSTERAPRGQRIAPQRAQPPRRPRKRAVHRRLRADGPAPWAPRWSPAQSAQRRARADPADPTLRGPHETIDTSRYVRPRGALKRERRRALRPRRTHRKRRGSAHARRGRIPDRIRLEARPAAGADRTVPDHGEGDRLLGRRHASARGTLVERTTRPTLRVPLRAKDATRVRRAFARERRPLPPPRARSLTSDRGKAMTAHRLFTQATRIPVCCAPPQSPWERGTNENTHGRVRQCFPKGTDFSSVSRRAIKQGQNLLSGRPRKGRPWRTPREALHTVPVALET